MSLQLTNVSIVIQILLYIAKKSISRFVYSRHYCILNKVPSAGRYQVEHRNTSLYKVEELNVCRRTQFRYKKLCGHVRISFGSFYYEASPELCHTWAQYSLLIGWSVTQYSGSSLPIGRIRTPYAKTLSQLKNAKTHNGCQSSDASKSDSE